jgi:Domain of unknown function (DUF1929)
MKRLIIAFLLFSAIAAIAQTFQVGETNVLSGQDNGNANLALTQSVTLTQAGTLQSLSFYVTTAAGNLVLGLYGTNSAGTPGQLLASTKAFVPVVGWNTQPVVSQVALTSGTYWLAYGPSSNSLGFAIGAGGKYYLQKSTYTGILPATFAQTSSGPYHWSFYATLSGSSTSTFTMGETNVLSGQDNGNANLILGQSATLSQTGTLQSLSFYVTTAAGNLVLGLYGTNSSGTPGTLLASTKAFVPVVGWNTQPVVSQVTLNPGTYWLAYGPSSNSLGFAIGAGGKYYLQKSTYTGTLPATFAQTSSGPYHWSLYATLSGSGSGSGSSIPAGGPTANVTGVFGGVVQWNLIPLHVVLLPDGRVMSYGTDSSGNQGAQFIYEVWTPSLGTGTNAHLVLNNTTATDIFCSAASVMYNNGKVLTTGGDLTVNGQRNFANNLTTVFDPSTNTIASNTPMQYPRWYPSLVALPNGKLAVFGGLQNVVPPLADPVIPTITPEVYDPTTAVWTTLTGATSNAAFGGVDYSGNWYYPRSYVAPGGNVFVLGHDGTMYTVTIPTSGAGTITQLAPTAPAGFCFLPTIPFAPGKVLSIRLNQIAVVVDFTQSVPVVTQTDNIDQDRFWSTGTVMADGRVLVNGGSTAANVLTGVAYQATIWDPSTGHWTGAASAAVARLYHSNALLLQDATVLTGGGGAPGPLTNTNAEIFYPPYLYKNDGSGQPATRPTITAATPQSLLPGNTINVTVGSTDQISRLTFVRQGSSTHCNNSDQRFFSLTFQQTGTQLTATLPSDNTVLLPGWYMLFAFNSAGVPSIATVLYVGIQP